MSNREWAILCLFGGLLTVVILVGLLRNDLDTTGVALGIITLMTGILTGLIAKGRFGGGDK